MDRNDYYALHRIRKLWKSKEFTQGNRAVGGRAELKIRYQYCKFSSVQFSHPVVSDSLRPHESQHARPPYLSTTPRVHPNSCPLSWWCHPAISSSVVPFSSCPQSSPESGSFQMSQFFTSGGQSIAVSASTPVLPLNTQDCSPLGWTGWIFLQSKGLSRVFSNTTVQKYQFFGGLQKIGQVHFHFQKYRWYTQTYYCFISHTFFQLLCYQAHISLFHSHQCERSITQLLL